GTPSARAITRAVRAVAAHSSVGHPLTTHRTDTNRVEVLTIAADRGMAGAYSANAIREAERLRERLIADGNEVVQYASGRRAVSYYGFRHRELAGQWVGGSDAPTHAVAKDVATTLFNAFTAAAEDGGVSELHVVYTHFTSMVSQETRVIRMLPLEIVEGVAEPGEGVAPLYDFEPSAEGVLDALLPRYIEARIY